ncbi:adhesion G protein-coupled receptor L3 [Eurytemora carolleeae]|uniref:adhesion G protein-coupled receptor L3 n=1 Tax=Eurytemora carolleeae TaxID=1294199 RepID=UPI000C7815ED|nr:adhesion G protein-coupled receptor L3 [Eurytemora carolleeae]|eukprot:XP_023324882.1 adhesion G protein-coupled receptor L3-like [Eurytemora affinis]
MFDNVSSTLKTTVCICNHLTNFGIMMDWKQHAPTDNPFLNLISTVLLLLSCFCLFLTEVILTVQRSVERSPLRRSVERHRNYCLFIAQMCFMLLTGGYKNVSCTLCQVFGGVIHFFWLTVFAWTVIGGYLIYICLFQVFLPKSIPMMKFYLVGYGIPSFMGKKTLLVFFLKIFGFDLKTAMHILEET